MNTFSGEVSSGARPALGFPGRPTKLGFFVVGSGALPLASEPGSYRLPGLRRKSGPWVYQALCKQGIGVYSESNNRLLAAGEYFARVSDFVPTPFLSFGTTDWY